MGHEKSTKAPIRALLIVLLSIFCFRVLAHFAIRIWPVPGLPNEQLWHSATMPYGVLLFTQLAIISLMVLAIGSLGRINLPRPISILLRCAGWIYLIVMALRLIIGAFDLSTHSWFDGAVSTTFHFVIAAFMLVLAQTGKDPNAKEYEFVWSRYLAYPLLISGSYALFVGLKSTGSPLLFSSYLAVMIGTLGVLLHESLNPARTEWRPDQKDVVSDGIFLVVVQVGLPAILKILIPALIISLAGSGFVTTLQIWPQSWPLLAQVAMMLVIAEFFRYWLHRLMHEFTPLWRLHAVHHASDKLYTVNVGRFHPLDKSIQFFGDSLPFLLLGVSPEVFAAYFVIYAVNGFYQHSNADIRLGPLNWIVAGPELHRWHHSTVVAEGHSNYGNNLIIWDVVFGTRLLPPDRTVEEVGIGNKKWPRGFIAQIIAPVTQPTEHDP